ncbi:ATP-binding cassette domain-containing protein, partial [Enterococcus cecorum]|uniref:ATP-binding cassette domain-containing protein n=1 Tax=Enterococcus cecorum TaxID=44008 RepID=UPI001FADE178
MSHNHLEVKNLNYSYPNHTFALKNIQMSLKSGNIYGLVGKNGAGKTTLLDNLAGYYAASYPTLLCSNEPYDHDLIKKSLGFHETNILLYGYLTSDENKK